MTLPPPPAMPPGLESLLPAFADEMARDTERLRILAGGPADVLAEHVHAMRGKCAMFGEDILFDLLSRLERCAQEEFVVEGAVLIERILARASQLRDYVPIKQAVPPP